MRGFLAVLMMLELLGPEAAAQSPDVPDMSQVAIQQVNARGSGCAADTVSVNLSPDGEAMTLIFDDYSVEGGASEDRLGKTKKDCNIQMRIATPPGWTFSILSLTLRGYADLDPGVNGIQSAKYRLGRKGRDAELSRLKLAGEYRDNYEQSFDLPLASANWADCGGSSQTLNLATSIAVKGERRANGAGVMTVDSLDGEMNQEYGIMWRRCDEKVKFVAATCRAQFDDGRGRKRLRGREIMSHGRGRSAAEAMAKARQKIDQKCQKRSGRNGGTCVIPDNACRVL